MSLHAYIPIKATVASHPKCLCVSGTKGASLCMMPECPPPIQVPSGAPDAVPVACVGSVDLTGGKLQDLLGGPAPGVWVGLDVKQLRGQAEVGVLGGRGNVDLELGWGGEPVCSCLGASRPGPTLSGLWGPSSNSPTMPSGGCPLGAKARSHPQLPPLVPTFDQLCPQDPSPPSH